jgi:ATP-dependent DNA helicase DinG
MAADLADLAGGPRSDGSGPADDDPRSRVSQDFHPIHPVADADLARVLGPDGPLAKKLPGYRSRPQQLEMATRIAHAIRDAGTFVCEAGTGTGKTVAYLVPALLSGAKVIISTGTKPLQDQLFRRDLPMVRDALGIPVTAALLKGRSNYVCHYHLERNLHDGRLPDRESVVHLQQIVRFAKQSRSGDRSDFPEVPEDSPAWNLATSTRENCLGTTCSEYNKCFVMGARRDALAADVVVVNHHLFFADVMLRDEGLTELLPACNAVIFDEAHQLADVATLFFGESVSTGQMIDLARDTRAAAITAAKDLADLPLAAATLERAARDLRLALPREGARLTARDLRDQPDFRMSVAGAEGALAPLAKSLEAVAERDDSLAACARRATEMLDSLRRWRDADDGDAGVVEDDEDAFGEAPVDDAVDAGKPAKPSITGPLVRWAEAYTQSLALHATPLEIAPIFRRQMQGRPRAWIFTSATLAVGKSFTHYLAELGLDGVDAEGQPLTDTACWESPFDYANHAMLCVPDGLPDPNSREHTEAVVAAALRAIRASRGRAFLLFTTLRAMRYAHELLQEKFKAEGLDYPLMVQGEGSRSELLERFRRLGNAVLVAAASFWEGVDVKGEALSLVVIDKLPFAPPDDPVLEARLDRMKRAGGNPFMDYQLPQAAIALKQGAGRLIRDENDRGVLMICDKRIVTKPYGRRIWGSLPPMKRSRDLADVEAFFASSDNGPEPTAGA